MQAGFEGCEHSTERKGHEMKGTIRTAGKFCSVAKRLAGPTASAGTTAFFVAFGISGAALAAASSTAGDELTTGLDEIVVTAQKKSENIQNVPETVNVISAQQISDLGAKQLSDYAATVPGLQIDSAGAPGQQTISIRGISTGSQFGSATAAIYVDDVPIGSSSPYAYGSGFGLDLLPYDLSRLEILEGPQGTLYGASSLGGLVKYVTTTPSLSEMSFRVGGDLSSIDHGTGTGSSARGAANIVLIPDQLALIVSGSHSYTPGYINNLVTGQQGRNDGTQDGGRISLYWRPIDSLSVNLGVIYNASNFNSSGRVPVNADGSTVYGRYDDKEYEQFFQDASTTLYSANVKYDFGPVNLTSVTGYSQTTNKIGWNYSIPLFTSLGLLAEPTDVIPVNKFSQEIRLASSDTGDLQWTVGDFYTEERAQLNERIRAYSLAALPSLQPVAPFDPFDDIGRPSVYQEEAVFGNATYLVLPQWDVNGGFRYSHNDQRVFTYGEGPGGSQGLAFGELVGATPTYKSSQDVTTWSVTSRYHIDEDSMAYVRVATGYRPGGSNAGVVGAPTTFESDKLTNYEFGIKSQLLDHRLRLNGDVFYIDWKNIQIQQLTSANLGFTGNGGAAKSKGFELATEYSFTPQLRLGGNVLYDEATLSVNAPAAGGSAGDPLPLSAKWNASIVADWSHSLGDDRKVSVNALWRYVGDRYADFPGGANYFYLKAYNTLDLSVGVTQGQYSFRLFARNLRDEYAYTRYGTGYATLLQPRTVGLSADVTF
jgi:iron complex outermembrane recepter protein